MSETGARPTYRRRRAQELTETRLPRGREVYVHGWWGVHRGHPPVQLMRLLGDLSW